MNKDDIIKKLPWLIFAIILLGPMLNSRLGAVIFLIIIIFIFYKILSPKFQGININNNMGKTIDVGNLEMIYKTKRIVFGVVVIILALWLFFSSIQVIEAGETGVYSLFGKVKDSELKSGFHLVIPLAKVTRMSIRTEEYTMTVTQDEGRVKNNDAITSLTKEGLKVDLDMTVLYHLDENRASDIYKEVGLAYDEKVIRPAIRTTIREVVARYEAKDLYSEKRAEATKSIAESLRDRLGDRGVIVEDVLLRNVALPSNLANSIQEKLQAEQEAQKYDFILEKEKKEKERKLIEAEGQRDAQRIINESLSTNYLYYLYINELKDREGTIYVPTGSDTGMPLFRDIGR